MVYTCLCLYYFYSFLLAEFSQYFSYILLQLTVYFFPPILRYKYYMILTSTFWMCRTFYFICTFLSHCQKPPWYFLVMRSPNHLLLYHGGFSLAKAFFPLLKAPIKMRRRVLLLTAFRAGPLWLPLRLASIYFISSLAVCSLSFRVAVVSAVFGTFWYSIKKRRSPNASGGKLWCPEICSSFRLSFTAINLSAHIWTSPAPPTGFHFIAFGL